MNSAVVKSTLYIEALTQSSLIPWYHYVPLSIRYTELYPLLGYFFSSRSVDETITKDDRRAALGLKDALKRSRRSVDHDDELKAIAEQGAEWARTCSSEESAVVYLYLLLLEWGRVSSPGRDNNLGVVE